MRGIFGIVVGMIFERDRPRCSHLAV